MFTFRACGGALGLFGFRVTFDEAERADYADQLRLYDLMRDPVQKRRSVYKTTKSRLIRNRLLRSCDAFFEYVFGSQIKWNMEIDDMNFVRQSIWQCGNYDYDPIRRPDLELILPECGWCVTLDFRETVHQKRSLH